MRRSVAAPSRPPATSSRPSAPGFPGHPLPLAPASFSLLPSSFPHTPRPSTEPTESTFRAIPHRRNGTRAGRRSQSKPHPTCSPVAPKSVRRSTWRDALRRVRTTSRTTPGQSPRLSAETVTSTLLAECRSDGCSTSQSACDPLHGKRLQPLLDLVPLPAVQSRQLGLATVNSLGTRGLRQATYLM